MPPPPVVPPMNGRLRALSGVASQGVTSATNFLIVIAIARTQTPDVLGAWTLGFAVITFATTLSRATISTPVILAGASDRERDVRGGLTASLLVGLLAGAFVVGLGAVGVMPISTALVLAVSGVFAIGQDFLRYSWIARGLPHRALVLDMTWLGAQSGLTVALAILGTTSEQVWTASWGCAAVISLGIGVVLDRNARVSVAAGMRFARHHRSDSSRLFGESLAYALAANLQPFVVTAFVGYAAAGALKVAQTLFAPLTTLVAGLSPVVLRELSRRLERGLTTRRIRVVWQVSLGALNLVYGAVILLLPEGVGVALAGSSWPTVSLLLVPLAVQALLRPPMTIAQISLRAGRHFSLLQNASWILLLPSILLPGLLGLLWGVPGVGWGLVVDFAVRTTVFAIADYRLRTDRAT